MFSSAVTGLAGHNSKTACDVWQPEFGQGQQTQENSYRFRGIVRRIVTQEPKDALRKGFSIKGLDAEGQQGLDSFNERREFLSKFETLRGWARKYAGAGMLMNIDDGRDWSEPVNFQNIRRVGQLTVLDRCELEVRDYEHDIESGVIYSPKAYYLVSDNQREVHPSRIIIMHGIKLTPREMMQNNGWGESVINAVWKALRDYLTTHSYLAEAVTRLTQGVLTMPSLEGAMTGCDAEKVEERMQSLAFWMGALGDIALTTDESYEVHTRSMAGMPEVARVFFEQLVVETEIPMTILGGQTPGGLNTGANTGEWQSWTSHLSGEQVRTYNPAIRQYMNVVFRAGNSPIADTPDDWSIEWPELFEPNMVEFSNALAQTANAGVLLQSAGMYTRNEIRNNPLLTKAFPHSEGVEVSDDIDDSFGEPEGEELSIGEE
jgi:phage-related protein (TIGR01555 family)